MDNNTQRIALVTGANKGIGYEIARQLASGGAMVLVGARDQQRGEESSTSPTARPCSGPPKRWARTWTGRASPGW